jgi:hypothetical protein
VRKVLTEDEEPDEVGLGSSSENWKKYNEDRYLENEILMNDINNFKKIYGEKSIIIKYFSSHSFILKFTLSFSLNTHTLSSQTYLLI